MVQLLSPYNWWNFKCAFSVWFTISTVAMPGLHRVKVMVLIAINISVSPHLWWNSMCAFSVWFTISTVAMPDLY